MNKGRAAYLVVFMFVLGTIFIVEVRLPAGFPFGAPTTTTTGQHESCTAGWNVTGYFTPIETDYSGPTQSTTVNGTIRTFYSSFLASVQVEGWGKTKAGDYISYDNAVYSASAAPENSLGDLLKVGDAAVDFAVIQAGTNITIPSLPAPWNTTRLIADDSGTGIVGPHVDVYTGLGAAAEQETLRITGNDQTVCHLVGQALAAPQSGSLTIQSAQDTGTGNTTVAYPRVISRQLV